MNFRFLLVTSKEHQKTEQKHPGMLNEAWACLWHPQTAFETLQDTLSWPQDAA